MRFYRRYGATIVESEALIKFAGYLSAGEAGLKEAKAAAFFPFVFVREESYATPIFINHERIHFRQQIEMFFIGSWLIQIIEDIYSGLFLKLNSTERYLYRAIEQEAYRNQNNLEYLKHREVFSVFKYLRKRNKRKLTFIPHKEPEVLIGEKF